MAKSPLYSLIDEKATSKKTKAMAKTLKSLMVDIEPNK